ncbi:uncharacterized protein [Onthophagus taurus]|uniref:uncharacterized protein n=1 Tax=Onthophagus taurus TaxID=166361 RepID=UPI000C1FE8F8|nr:uncharacterized protein LOC111426323 [Onthophagus taurus]
MKIYFITALIPLLYLQQVESLSCFQCDYSNYMDCHNNITCLPTIREHVACYKFVVKDGAGNTKYTKGCGKYVDDFWETCSYFEELARIRQENIVGCFNCEYDGCNSSETLQSTPTLLIGVLIVLFRYKLR